MIKPDLFVVTQAVESLYTDQLKPFGRLLRKRIAEHSIGVFDGTAPAAKIPEQLPNVDAKHLETVCRTSDRFHVESEEGGDWSVVIAGRPQPFIDIYCGTDVYPAEMWAAAAAYFESLPEEEMQLPGGRYSCAQALLRRRTPFLAGYTLGQACHIVELGIALHKILGYSNGSVVPYSRSQSAVKEQCAGARQCAGDAADGAPPAASWDRARQCLREILGEEANVADAAVPLSNVKRLFRSRYGLDLSETTLGYSKLSELLQDVRFSDVCTVQLQAQGYMVKRVLPPVGEVLPDGEAGADPQGQPRRVVFATPSGEQLCLEDPSPSHVEGRRLDFCMPLPTPLESPGVPPSTTVRRWTASAPCEPCRLVFCPDEPPQPLTPGASGLLQSLLTPLPSPGVATPVAAQQRWCPDEPLCFEEAGFFTQGSRLPEPTPIPSPGIPPSAMVRRWNDEPAPAGGCAPQPPTPSGSWRCAPVQAGTPCRASPPRGAARRSRSAPKDLASPAREERQHRAAESTTTGSSSSGSLDAAGTRSPSERSEGDEPLRLPMKVAVGGPPGELSPCGGGLGAIRPLCACEPLTLEDPGELLAPSTPQQDWPTPLVVRNTFLQAPSAPPTPAGPTAAARARSLPRDMGSERLGGWAAASPRASRLPPRSPAGARSGARARGAQGSAALVPPSPALTASPGGVGWGPHTPGPAHAVLRLADLI